MRGHNTLGGRALALAACAVMLATPAVAAPMPASKRKPPPIMLPLQQQADALDSQDQYRRWRRRDNGIDAGDVIAGVIILGGIAAIASAASRSERDRRERSEDRRYRDREPEWKRDASWNYRDRDRSRDWGDTSASAMDRAVDRCEGELSREGRIDQIDQVVRDGDGWRVAGSLSGGRRFSCAVNGAGGLRDLRIDSADGSQGWGTAPAERIDSSEEWDMRGEDERYNSAGVREGELATGG